MAGTVVGKLEGDPATTRGYYDVLSRRLQSDEAGARRCFFDQNWASLNKLMPVASGGISRRSDASVVGSFGRRRNPCSSVAAPSVIRWASRRGATAKSRGAGSDDPRPQRRPATYLHEGPEILAKSPRRPARRLKSALEVWKNVTFKL